MPNNIKALCYKATEKEIKAFYKSDIWIKVKDLRMLIDRGLCQHCLEKGETKLAVLVHHIIEIRVDWSRRLDMLNLISLCKSCHNKAHPKSKDKERSKMNSKHYNTRGHPYQLDEDELELRGEKVPSKPIPEEMYKRFKFKLEEHSKRTSHRNMMIFYLGIATGYRLQDIVCLTIGELIESCECGYFIIQEQKQFKTWETYMLEHPNSKKKKPGKRKAEIKKNLANLIKEYTKGKKKSSYAFPSSTQKGYIESKSYSRILSDVGKNLELKNISGHSLRKTYAHRQWRKTRDLEFVRKALGHQHIETTKLYLGDYEGTNERAASIADDML